MSLRRVLSFASIVCCLSVPAAAQINFPDFASASGLTLNGVAATVNNGVDAGRVLRLVPAVFNVAGSGFASRAVCISRFSSSFKFRITGAGPAGTPDASGQIGADGLTMTIAGGPGALGGAGGGLGYQGVAPSVAVEFDTWLNGGEPSSNHVGIDINGSVASVVAVPVPGRFDDGTLWSAWVDYDGANLQVRVSNTGVRPAAPTVSLPIDLRATLFSGTAYAGFSAGTGAAFGNHDIVSWNLEETCANLTIDGCDSGVLDHRMADGSLMSQSIQACAIAATNHGGFVSCVADRGTASMKAGSISGRERGAIQSCAARSSFYKGPVKTDEFIENGGFETGNGSGWLLVASPGAQLSINNGTLDPAGPAGPQLPIDGAYDLVSHSAFVHVSRAMQVLNVPLEVHAATLEWSDRIQAFVALLDPSQEYRVMLRRLDLTPIAELYSTNPGDPLTQLGPNNRSVDLTAALQALKGQTILVSFEHRIDFYFFTVTLDQVSLTMTYR